jgi:hypothetical protein
MASGSPSCIWAEVQRQRLDCRPGAFECRVDVGGLARLLAASVNRTLAFSSARSTGSSTRRQYRLDRMETRELDYDLPAELIAQHPAPAATRRGCSSTTAARRSPPSRRSDLPDELGGELVVVNDTRVLPPACRSSGRAGEVLLLEPLGDGVWEGSRGRRSACAPGGATGPSSCSSISARAVAPALHGEPAGETPLPPYIVEPLADPEQYQTVYAREPGRRARRRPACTSRRSCCGSSTWSA